MRPIPARRDTYSVFIPLDLRWNDVDIYGHVNNAVYFQLFDTAINNWLIANSLFQKDDASQCLVARHACDFFREVKMTDRVVIGLGIKKLGGSSITYAPALFVNEDETAAAQGDYIHVAVDRATHRPIIISDEVRSVLERLGGSSV